MFKLQVNITYLYEPCTRKFHCVYNQITNNAINSMRQSPLCFLQPNLYSFSINYINFVILSLCLLMHASDLSLAPTTHAQKVSYRALCLTIYNVVICAKTL